MGGAFGVAFFLEPVAVAADVDDGWVARPKQSSS